MKFTYLNIAKSVQKSQLLAIGEMQAISQTYIPIAIEDAQNGLQFLK